MSELREHRMPSDGKPDFSIERMLKDAEERNLPYEVHVAEMKRRYEEWMALGVTPTEICNLWDLQEDGYTWRNKFHGLRAYVKNDAECTHLWFDQDEAEMHADGCYHHICSLYDFIECLQTLRLQAYAKGILNDPDFKDKLS